MGHRGSMCWREGLCGRKGERMTMGEEMGGKRDWVVSERGKRVWLGE